jgi:hypothetical protein
VMVSRHKISHVYALKHDNYEGYLPQKMKSITKCYKKYNKTKQCINDKN